MKHRFRFGPYGSHTLPFTKTTRLDTLARIKETKGWTKITEERLTNTGPGWQEWSPVTRIREGYDNEKENPVR